MSNALKFTPPGGVVTVSVRFSDELGPVVDQHQRLAADEETNKGFRMGGGGHQHTSAGSSGGPQHHGSLSRLGSSLRGILAGAAAGSSSKKGGGGFGIQPQPPTSAAGAGDVGDTRNSNLLKQTVGVHANNNNILGSNNNQEEDSRSCSTPSAGGSSPRAALGTNGDDYGVNLMAFMPFVHHGGEQRDEGRRLSRLNLIRRRKRSGGGPARSRRPKYLILEVTDTGVGIEKVSETEHYSSLLPSITTLNHHGCQT